jgi:hypothetical protein
VDIRRLATSNLPAALLPRLNGTVMPATDGVPVCHAETIFNLEWIDETSPPFDRIPVRVPRSGQFEVTGWAVDKPGRMAAADLDIFVDGRFVTSSYYGLDRPDVATYFQDSVYRASGFTARINVRELGGDLCTLSIRLLAGDRSCYYEGPRVPIQVR